MPRVSPGHLEARRQQILDGARAAFARHGYEGATVRVLEEEIGLSRGAIFHHFPDKEALFLALAEQDAELTVATIADQGLIQVLRDFVHDPDPGRIGTQLEIARRWRTDAAFRQQWDRWERQIRTATRERLRRQRDAGALRRDVEVEPLAGFLELVRDGLLARLAAGGPTEGLDQVLDLAEGAVRRAESGVSAG
ncbi:TetR/AcrR family transcriptional regulator [Nakamurella flava]|uniref:TetR/AcrR family transcriptional regulator n=1 Tax=Nakamurella flava TaxID=2576308 RepID=A0A4U6QJQ1_9ACTN|nr:TetR/AcrR family transcriptional regulator [Nakamurella flava]TKV60710.1 TetR/AcrR family transcriptional regulator [Nakamurella flava]